MDLGRLERRLASRTPQLMDCDRYYAVLVPLVEREGELSVLYEVRARTLRRQPGEVCFPGGRMEAGETAEACALRETWEELALPPSAVHVLGRLDFIAHRSNFCMQPVLARVDGAALDAMCPSPAEVEEAFLVPLAHLLDHPPLEYEYRLVPETRGFPNELVGIPEDYRWQAGKENVPVYPWGKHAVWGLTGRITRNLVKLLSE